MYHSFLIHSSADGHLGCFHLLAIINSAALNIGVHVSLSDLVSSVCMPRSGIAGSYGTPSLQVQVLPSHAFAESFLTPFNPPAPSSVPWETLTRQWTTCSVSRGSRSWLSPSQSQGTCQDPVNVRDTADERGRETGNGEVRGEGWESER